MRTEWENYLNKYNLPNETWYNFESIISIITNECFIRYFDTYIVDKSQIDRDTDKEKYEYEISNINRIYKDIYYEFRNFINERNTKSSLINDNLLQIIEKNTPVISFNYTNLIKKYSNKVYYIHGSIDENFIIFGYSPRSEYDYIDPNAAIYDKSKFRELLNYVRYIMENHNIKINNLEFFVDEYLPHLLQSTTGKGGWNLKYPESFIKKCEQYLADEYDLLSYHHEYYNLLSKDLKDEARNYRLKQISAELNSYLELNKVNENKKNSYTFNFSSSFNLYNVNRLTIIGHGLEADLDLFRELFENLKNLNEVILLVYNGESQKDIERKVNQIKKFTSCDISTRKY